VLRAVARRARRRCVAPRRQRQRHRDRAPTAAPRPAGSRKGGSGSASRRRPRRHLRSASAVDGRSGAGALEGVRRVWAPFGEMLGWRVEVERSGVLPPVYTEPAALEAAPDRPLLTDGPPRAPAARTHGARHARNCGRLARRRRVFARRTSAASGAGTRRTSHGFQELAVEYFARAAWDQCQLNYTILRPFNCVSDVTVLDAGAGAARRGRREAAPPPHPRRRVPARTRRSRRRNAR
jgi:hypothetical protein